MPIERIGYYEADLDLIERSASQARQTNVNKNIEDLALSIEVQGLMEPVLVVEIEKDRKYELIDGQRRLQAFLMLREKNHEKYKKIPSFRYKNTMHDWEKKAISINANLTQQPMDDDDKINGVTAVYNHFNSVKLTAKHTGLSEPTIRKYVKYVRLPEELKKAKDAGEISLQSALDAADLYDYDPTEKKVAPIADMVETAREIDKLAGEQKKRVKELVRTDPDKPKKEIIDTVVSVKRKSQKITIEVESETFERIGEYKEKKDHKTVELATYDLVQEGLKANS